jgi:hypothetical protein
MALKLQPKNGSAHLSEIVSYSITVDALGVDVNDSSGSTGSMQLSLLSSNTKIDKDGNRVDLPGYNKSSALLGREVSLIDDGMYYTESKFDYAKQEKAKGSFVGTVSSLNFSSSDISQFSVDSLLFKFNCEKTAEPHFGPGATQKTAFIYYCSLAGVEVYPNLVSSDFEVPVAYGAWKGNVWEHIKMFCIANKADILVNYNGLITLRKIRHHTIPVIENSGASINVDLLGSSRFIEIQHYDNSWESDAVIYSTESALQVDQGEYIKEIVDIDFSTTDDKIIQPECVKSIEPIPFDGGIGKSVYVVLDNLNIPVEPEWWNDNGGRVVVNVSKDNPLQLEIQVNAPNQKNSAYAPPYKLAEQYDDVVKPALYICGEGVKINKKLRSVATGADQTFISRDSKATVDNPFVTDISYHLGQSALFATGPNISVNLTIGSSGLLFEMNEICGSRFLYNNGYYRVVNANISDGGIGLTGKVDTTFDDLTDTFSETFAEYNSTVTYSPNNFNSFNADTARPSNTFNGFNSVYPALTFDQVALYYAESANPGDNGMSFSDMAFMPLGDKLNPYDN